jgi:DNA-binding response OmpR family regulator
VKKRSPQTGVLVITGNSTLELLAAALNMGVDAYLTKPFKMADLDEQLNRVLRRTGPLPPGSVERRGPLGRALRARVPIVWVLLAVAALVALSRVALR